MEADIGLIGLAVMGENLALNIESKGYTVAVYNRTTPLEQNVVERFVAKHGQNRNFIATRSIESLVEAVHCPRKIMMMVKSGQPVDELISQLLPYLTEGDILIDGGNSDYHDTERRVSQLEKKGILFVGCGISGGAEGALHGPSVMPGGSPQAWPQIKEFLQRIAAKLDDGQPCCEWMGNGGAGHFVKTVHNGIEYGDMQLIAETYDLLRHRKDMDNEGMADLFDRWNQGELDSFLMEITARILRYRDKDGRYLLSHILDVAGQKGTGQWTLQAALDGGEPFPIVAEAVFARMLSARFDEREKAASLYPMSRTTVLTLQTEEIRMALYASKLTSYAQGFSLLKRTSDRYGWQLNIGDIARIWRRGCIIRSAFLQQITTAYVQQPNLENLLFSPFFHRKITESLSAWRKVVSAGALGGIALPATAAALNYFHGLSMQHSTANLIQAQRDFFGAHTYERTDRERGLFFHTDWSTNNHHPLTD